MKEEKEKKPFLKEIEIENLQLDRFNPRLPKSKQNKTETDIIEFLLLEAATHELMESIGENNFFFGELLLVIPNKNEDGKYIVIEGNRRLTAVKLLNNPDLATVKKITVKDICNSARYKPAILPCLVFKDRDEVQKYVGFVHITGKKSWRVLEKARYLFDLRNSDKFRDYSLSDACKEIARMIGSRSPYVRKMIVSYQLYLLVEDEKFYKIYGLTDESFYLNYFSDGMQKENIRKYLGVNDDSEEPLEHLNKEHLENLVRWWFEKNQGVTRVIGDSEGMRMLNSVLGNEEALMAFLKGERIETAYELTNDINTQFESKIRETLASIEKADSLSNRVKKFYSDLYDDLKTIRSIANKINEFRKEREEHGDEF